MSGTCDTQAKKRVLQELVEGNIYQLVCEYRCVRYPYSCKLMSSVSQNAVSYLTSQCSGFLHTKIVDL